MDNFTVDLPSLAGFTLDLQDLSTNFSSNAAQLLSAVSLPTGSSGLMGTLSQSFETFHTALSTAHSSDVTAVDTLGTKLTDAQRGYRSVDDGSASTISTLLTGDNGSTIAFDETIKRFSALQLPTLPTIDDATYTLRNVVTASANAVAPFDDALSAAIGIKPAANYLTPLASDWESLQVIGRTIGQLSINDFVASQNLSTGIQWLQGFWTKDASQAFGESARGLWQSVWRRSDDLDAVSRIVEYGGACIERLVYNQSVGLAAAVTQPMSFLGFTLPLGSWAQVIDSPMRDSMKSEITTAAEALKTSADARHTAITTIVDTISTALNYSNGREIPAFNATDFEIPEKMVAGTSAQRYGFGSQVWWEVQVASAS
ncbi:hypothetical protein H0264_29950 [Nocardia huaxiensis]|uniref:Excreted virulence factor EspC (Type VII ESX diderm) n=1 Tax=Nocardia huaxiensis TaxID=2755382 RepID=A0A7D6Z8B0_9NOCA|nr:hypothetical protein [Nocardia huaxiensis]QLY29448.1 hypothetical protein H0264_29950 [Nocardia huaxiensis]